MPGPHRDGRASRLARGQRHRPGVALPAAGQSRGHRSRKTCTRVTSGESTITPNSEAPNTPGAEIVSWFARTVHGRANGEVRCGQPAPCAGILLVPGYRRPAVFLRGRSAAPARGSRRGANRPRRPPAPEGSPPRGCCTRFATFRTPAFKAAAGRTAAPGSIAVLALAKWQSTAPLIMASRSWFAAAGALLATFGTRYGRPQVHAASTPAESSKMAIPYEIAALPRKWE